MVAIITLMALVSIVAFFYMRQAKFGENPSGKRLARIKNSSHYKNGAFQNIHETPAFTEGANILGVMYQMLFKKAAEQVPVGSIPSMKTNLLRLSPEEDILVWFGHSSYFLQIDGKRILVDPVFSGNASPIPGSNKAFKGTDRYTVDDLPAIDYLLISHDHYDHVDYETLAKLKAKTKKVVCGLGVGAHLEAWGYSFSDIIEKDWNESVESDEGFNIYTTTARHFSGRGLNRNNTLWLSFVLQTPTQKIYLGGDSGYDTHFAEIGAKYGPFDLAILENGQYNKSWKYVHMHPDEVLRAAQDLKAKRLFPVHSGKFAMANHAWYEPLSRITELNQAVNIPLITPRIGEAVNLQDTDPQFSRWWVGVK